MKSMLPAVRIALETVAAGTRNLVVVTACGAASLAVTAWLAQRPGSAFYLLLAVALGLLGAVIPLLFSSRIPRLLIYLISRQLPVHTRRWRVQEWYAEAKTFPDRYSKLRFAWGLCTAAVRCWGEDRWDIALPLWWLLSRATNPWALAAAVSVIASGVIILAMWILALFDVLPAITLTTAFVVLMAVLLATVSATRFLIVPFRRRDPTEKPSRLRRL